MEIYVAKQPIFNEKEIVIAYELLYRNSMENVYVNTDGDKATSEVIVNSFLNIGLSALSEGKPCFINFTENLLKLKLPTYFSPLSTVVEILENVSVTKEMVEICKELKELGYTIALDDFFLLHGDELILELLQFIDILKIDFRATSREGRNQLMEYLKPFNLELKFLGEKIETREEYDYAVEDGYTYFQGYFFSKPIILNGHDIPPYYQSYLLVLEELDHPEPDLDHITQVIERDLSITYKLLKLINSPVIRPKYEVNSIKQAVVLLGLIEIKKWIYVLAIRGLQDDSGNAFSQELIQLSLTRAKLGELIAKRESNQRNSSKYFLLGMISLIESFLHMSIEDIIKDLPLANDIKEALLGKESHLKEVLLLIQSVERMKFNSKDVRSYSYEFSEDDLFFMYSEANMWADQFMKEMNAVD